MKNLKTVLSLLLMSLFILNNMNGQNRDNLIQPNIIIFYADDLGWQDTKLNDIDSKCPWETPNIMALAKDGINFTNAYSPAPTCAPSRCSIVTGLHPTKTKVTTVSGGEIPKATKISKKIVPFYPAGLMPEHITIAEVLKANGYKTGHSGKWHMGKLQIQKPTNQGFDFSFEGRGAHQGPKGKNNRTNYFATNNENDPYKLSDEKYPPFTKEDPKGISYPKDDVTENAISFINKNKEKPFFLYLAHWMVHYPIHSKNKKLLQYYCNKLGVDLPNDPGPVTTPGQTNPYYGAMVTTLDWSLGKVMNYLKETEDPRNPGKKLYETTYIFFSSDNGGCENHKTEIITDNLPLDQGKKFAQEGGIRVPAIIYGPNIDENKKFDGLMNQLDFFPTILNLTKSSTSKSIFNNLDGLDITNVLEDSSKQIIDKEGNEREFLWWHFPHGRDPQMQSAIRDGDFKLYKNYVSENYSLYRLYKNGKRLDIEEKHNVINKPEYQDIVSDLTRKLENCLIKYNAQIPYKNALEKRGYIGKEKASDVPKIISEDYNKKTKKATITIENRKSKIVSGYVLVKISDPEKQKRAKSTFIKIPLDCKDRVNFTTKIPKHSLEHVIILLDENNFMIKGKLTKS